MPTGITLDSATLEIATGDNQRLVATVTYSVGENKTNPSEVEWSSSNEEVASVSDCMPPLRLATMLAVPSAQAVILPFSSTVATLLLSDVHSIFSSDNTAPSFLTVAVRFFV